MEYLTVGTKEIKKDLFVPVKDSVSKSIKPTGGMWFTKYNPQYENYNEWVDYLIDNPSVLFYKNKSDDFWNQPCSLVKLKDTSKIFTLDSSMSYEYLVDNFPFENSFSYEQMSHKYDGIFVDVLKLLHGIKHEEQVKIVKEFCVGSLLLFNTDCIDYYSSGCVSITPFDLEYYMYENPTYTIKFDKIKKKVK